VHVVATAGHVDHGKSTLIRALTGVDPDRLAAEKARGMTIELGFAHLVLPSGREIDFVDVPGHRGFISNMLSGFGAVDAALFIVDASEGWRPQSEEHLRILEFLGIGRGVVALTKADLADDDTLVLAELDVTEHLAQSAFAGAEKIAVSAATGSGLDALRAALDRLVATTPTAPDLRRPRLWIDRTFPIAGAGTVVTGSLGGGSIAVGDELSVIGRARRAPGRARVRALQTHGHFTDSAAPGRRLAVNLAGVHYDHLARGSALVRAAQWQPTRTFDVRLDVVGALDHAVSARGAHKLHVGSGEFPVRVQIIGAREIEPGASGFARLRLAVALPLVPGDRFVLRESGRAETVGGGEVLDIEPRLPAARAAPDKSIERVVAERGWVEADVLERLTGQHVEPTLAGRWVVDPVALAATRQDLRARVEAAGAPGLDIAELDDKERAALDGVDGVSIQLGRVVAADAPALRNLALGWLEALASEPWSPPPPTDYGVEAPVVSQLVRQGEVVSCDDLYFAPSAIEEAAAVLAGLIANQPEGVTVADVRDALKTTRRFAVPLLAHLDLLGVTRRRGDLRVGGPRLPAVP
jgi:selenocysteine-specific elongation factor